MVSPPFKLRQELRDPALKEARLARMEELEHQLFERATGIVEAALSFHEIEPGQENPPPAWVEEYGEAGARQRMRVAQAGWAPTSLAPVAFKMAQATVIGSSRARAYRQAAKTLGAGQVVNVKIALPAPTSEAHPGPVAYAVKELDP